MAREKAHLPRGRPVKAERKPERVPVPRRANTKYDWTVLKQEFIEGRPIDPAKPDGPHAWTTLKQLAEDNGVKYDYMRNRASQEKWTELQESYKAQFMLRRQRARMSRMVNEAVDMDDAALAMAKLGMSMVTMRLGEIAREQRLKQTAMRDYEQAMRNGDVVDFSKVPDAVSLDAAEMETLSRAGERWHNVGQKAMGIDTTKIDLTVNAGLNAGSAPVSLGDQIRQQNADDTAKGLALLQQLQSTQQLELGGGLQGEVVDAELVDDDVDDQQAAS